MGRAGPGGNTLKRMLRRKYGNVQLNHCTEPLKLTQDCKPALLQSKKKKDDGGLALGFGSLSFNPAADSCGPQQRQNTELSLLLPEAPRMLSCLSCIQLSATPCTIACRLLCPRTSPGKKTGVCCRGLLQGLFPARRWNLCLFCLRWQASSSPLPTWEARVNPLGAPSLVSGLPHSSVCSPSLWSCFFKNVV